MQCTSGAPSSNMLIHRKIALRVLLPKGFPVRVYALVCNVFKPLSKQYSSCVRHRQEQKSCLFSALRSVLESNDSGRNISCTTPTGHWVVLNDTVTRLLTTVSYSQRTIDHKGSLDIFLMQMREKSSLPSLHIQFLQAPVCIVVLYQNVVPLRLSLGNDQCIGNHVQGAGKE